MSIPGKSDNAPGINTAAKIEIPLPKSQIPLQKSINAAVNDRNIRQLLSARLPNIFQVCLWAC